LAKPGEVPDARNAPAAKRIISTLIVRGAGTTHSPRSEDCIGYQSLRTSSAINGLRDCFHHQPACCRIAKYDVRRAVGRRIEP
jgi:hypothetical protein